MDNLVPAFYETRIWSCDVLSEISEGSDASISDFAPLGISSSQGWKIERVFSAEMSFSEIMLIAFLHKPIET